MTSGTTAGTGSKADVRQEDEVKHSPASCAEQRTIVTQFASTDGTQMTYHGRVLVWDLAKSRSIELEFRCPWYSDRIVELFAWSEKAVTLDIYPEDSISPVAFPLSGPNGTAPRINSCSMTIPLVRDSSADSVRVTIVNAGAPEPGSVCLGLTRASSGLRTAATREARFDKRGRFLVYTWISVLCALFALFAPLGSYGFVLVGLPAVPFLLKYAGLDGSFKIDISTFSLWLFIKTHAVANGSALMRWLRPRILGLLCIPLSLAAVYVLVGLLVPLRFANDFEDALNSPPERMEDIELFCAYPERLEARALLARRFSLIRSESGAWGSAIQTIRNRIDTKTFLGCIESKRWARVFTDVPELREDEARAFYAALIFYSVNSFEEFPAAMNEIRQILRPGEASAGPLSELAWRTFQTRMEKNSGEDLYCGRDPSSKECAEAMARCRAAGKQLEDMLAQSTTWSYLDRRQNAIYIEARDVAASARLSPVCSAVTESDVRWAINHYEAMLGAIPGDPRLDRPLSSVNLRFLSESIFYPRSPKSPVQSWVRICADRLKRECAEIREAIIGNGDRKFFSKDRIAGNSEWDKASLAQANFKDLREFALAESKRNWRKPWTNRSG